jgi:DNA-binding beta-propeller fold protein YncE
VGLNPGGGVAFDGANIWVSKSFDNTITKLRASDGTFQGTFATGLRPSGLAFDGANIWVVNTVDSTVSKL